MKRVIKNKKAMELAISTIILLVLGVLVLAGFIAILVMGWNDFKTAIGSVFGSDVAKAQKACNLQCMTENKYDYCCELKQVKDEKKTCQDDILRNQCVLNCAEVVC